MRGLIGLFCTLLTLNAQGVEIEPGTHVLLRLKHSVSTETARPGDLVRLRTSGPLSATGRTIPAGSYTRGVIVRSLRAGRVRGRAELEIRFDSIVLADGTVVPVTGTAEIRPARKIREYREVDPPKLPFVVGIVAGYGTAAIVEKNSNSEDAIVNAGALTGVATGVLVAVLKRGDDLVLRAGSEIDSVLEFKEGL